MKTENHNAAARAPSPLRKRVSDDEPPLRHGTPETGFRTYRSERQMRDAVTAVVRASRWVRHGTPGF